MRQDMGGFVNVTQWHDWWWLWALEHCLAGWVTITHQPDVVAKLIINDAVSVSVIMWIPNCSTVVQYR